MAESEKVPFTWQIIIDCKLDQRVTIVADFNVILIDEHFDDPTQGILTSNRIFH